VRNKLSNKSQAPYVLCRDGVYYFVRRIPADVRAHHGTHRLYFSLRTKSARTAERAARSIAQRLDDYWMGVRLQKMDIPHLTVVPEWGDQHRDAPLLSEAVDLYVRLKGVNRGKIFHRATMRMLENVTQVLGDRPISAYASDDAGKFRDRLFDKGLTTVSVKRVFAITRAVINLAISEHGLDCSNAFARVYMPEDGERRKRQPIPIRNISSLQACCREIDDDLRWLVALISDTGMRLAEAAGLATADLHIDAAVPHVEVRPHTWRPLKTDSSARTIPLVGASLWAAQRIVEANTSPYAFPRYVDGDECNANSASATLNKWLKAHVPDGSVVHSFRHSLRDRLRAVECPSEIVDQIGGWARGSVGQGYGNGFPLDVQHRWMRMLVA
jgi:integrase